MVPGTQYARNGEVSIAYSVSGSGPVDLVFWSGVISHVEHLWEEPGIRRFLERIGSFARLILVDPRGSGLSDATEHVSAADNVADLDAVLDAAASERAAIVGYTTGGPLAVEYAVARPERVSHLVLYSAMAKMTAAPGYAFAHTAEQREAVLEAQLRAWGDGSITARVAPSRADDPALRAWFARLERLSSSPGNMRAVFRRQADVDVRGILPLVVAPTLVLHRRDDVMLDVRHSRYLAEHIPGARLVELEGHDSLISAGDSDSILGEIEEFLTGERAAGETQRALRTVIFTDLVDGTAQAASLGDGRWRELLTTHEGVIRRHVERFGGTHVKSTGDGALATFAGPPSAAVRCAKALVPDIEALGLRVRVGLHTGECELLGHDVAGMAINIAARVCALAGDGQILVSGTTYGTVVGSELDFAWSGEHVLKGVPGRWPIFELALRP